MSLYGNVKKIGSSTFQFDRQYNNRKEMDDNANSDGVYIGRYVLVEYGQRYVDTEGRNIDYNLISNQGAARLEGVVENENFRNNANLDLQTYGATYDSTVWQKIYVKPDTTHPSGDKYIMVAELNATTPRIEFIQEKPYVYRVPEEGETATDGIYAGNFDQNGYLENAVEVKNTVEEFRKPYFDLGLDTELSYLLHLPTAVNLEVNNDTIDINENGFNFAYSFGEKNKPSTIKWIPQGLTADSQGNLNDAPVEVDTQKLYMNLTAFGDVMNTLYDLLYGKPNATSEELQYGALRPYFQRYSSQIEQSNMDRTGVQVMVKDKDNNLVPLQILTYKDYPTAAMVNITVNGTIGESVLVPEPLPIPISGTDYFVFDPETDIFPVNDNGASIFQVCYKQGDTYLAYDKSTHSNPAEKYFYDTRIEPIQPLEFIIPNDINGITDNLEWMTNIPSLSEILENNTYGLASVLESLFGYKDPFTGTVKYYLYNDWLSKVEENSSNPCIINKPEVVSGITASYVKVNLEDEYNAENQYYKLLIDINRYVPFIGDNTSWDSAKADGILYTKSTTVSDGDYNVDFSTWEIVPTIESIEINDNNNEPVDDNPSEDAPIEDING